MPPHHPTVKQFPVTEEICYYDGPVLFMSDRQGVRYLVHLTDSIPEPTPEYPHAEARVYLAAPLTPQSEAALRSGMLGTRAHLQSLDPETIWVIRDGWTPSVTQHPASPIPDDWLPAPDALLSTWLRPDGTSHDPVGA